MRCRIKLKKRFLIPLCIIGLMIIVYAAAMFSRDFSDFYVGKIFPLYFDTLCFPQRTSSVFSRRNNDNRRNCTCCCRNAADADTAHFQKEKQKKDNRDIQCGFSVDSGVYSHDQDHELLHNVPMYAFFR